MLGYDRRFAGQYPQRERAEHPEEIARLRARGDGFGADPNISQILCNEDRHGVFASITRRLNARLPMDCGIC